MPLEAHLHRIPDDRFRPGGKERLKKLYRDFDNLGRWDDGTEEAYIDEASLRKLFRTHLPPDLEEPLMDGVRGLPGPPIRSAQDLGGAGGPQGGRRLDWEELTRRVIGDAPPTGDRLEDLGLTVSSPVKELRRRIKQRNPEAPDALLEPEALQLFAEGVVTKLSTGSSRDAEAALSDPWSQFWGCLAIAVGFFLLMVIGGMIIIILMEVLFGAALTLALVFGFLEPLVWFIGLFAILMIVDCIRRALELILF